MKVIHKFLLLTLLSISIVSAGISIHGATFTEDYFAKENIKGQINITLEEVLYEAKLTSNRGDSKDLNVFLDSNGVYTCTPTDCSNDYQSIGTSATSKGISITEGQDSYLGFLLTGDNVMVTGFDIDFKSNFGKGTTVPLQLEFFEDEQWSFSRFSNTFSTKNWGCYIPTSGTTGPYIKSSEYCQLVNLSETAKVRMGVRTSSYSTGAKNLAMNLYSGSGGFSLGECQFDASTTDYCDLNADTGTTFEEGEYQVCVSAPTSTEFQLYQETTGNSCGFVKALGPDTSVKDYAVFAQTAQFADYTELNITDMNLDELTTQADALIQNRYDRDCTNGCFLPIKATGVTQTLTAESLTLDAILDGEDNVINQLYELNIIPATLDFSGVIDLETTGFKVNTSGPYKLFIEENEILSKTTTILPSPVVTSIFPTKPPAGIPVKFTVLVDYTGNRKELEYEWDFGDGLIETTTEPNIEHIYPRLTNYTLTVTVTDTSGLSSFKEFDINTISPKEAINSTLQERKQALNQSLTSMNSFPEWYKQELTNFANLQELEEELNRIEKARDSAATDEQFLQVAIDLYALEIPLLFTSEKEIGIKLINEIGSINPLPVVEHAGGVQEQYVNEYRQPILNWQRLNIDAIISSDVVYVVMESGEKKGILRVYHLDVSSKDDEEKGYLIIEEEKRNINFNGAVQAYETETATIIEIEPSTRASLSFYKKNDLTPTTFFTSPGLANIVIEAAIDTTCNYNLVCEEGLGETWRTCRSDCKPKTRILIYSIIAFFIVLLIYILMQLWYKHLYEGHLFGDRKQLANLLNYISNARSRGMDYNSIEKELKKQGWTGERVHYAIKKARGKNTGLPEIIPFTKIGARKRKKQAQKKLQQQIATQNQQQNPRNINKSGFQQPYRGGPGPTNKSPPRR